MPLLVAAGAVRGLFALRYAPGTWRRPAAAVLGVAAWVALNESGIDPVIAGLGVGLVTSAYPPQRSDLEQVVELTRSFREQPTPELARSAQLSVASAISPNERLQYRLHPWTSYVIVPLFALANAGIHVTGSLLGRAVSSPITLGIVVGYVVGKPLGILGAEWLASRSSSAGCGRTLSWPALAGGGTVAGIGFTVSLLISSIAFQGKLLDEAKVGVLAAAVLATAPRLGGVPGDRATCPRPCVPASSIGTADAILDLSDDVDPERDHIRGSEDAPVTLRRIRRLRVSLLRPGRDGRPRPARLLRRRAPLRLARTCR